MAGYNWDAGMSNNAVDAYDQGLFPLSKLSAGLLKSRAIKITVGFARYLAEHHLWAASEWHHSSGAYNEINFYNLDLLQSFLTNCPDKAADHLADYKDLRERKKKEKEKNAQPRKVCGTWDKWTRSWTRCGRKKWRCEAIPFTGEKDGCWIYIDDPKKKKLANSSSIRWSYEGEGVPA